MQETKPVYIIDAGNTSIKVALFEGDTLIHQDRFDLEMFYRWAESMDKKDFYSAISSVRTDVETEKMLELLPKSLLLTHKSSVPIQINYGTANTLGMDRLCNAVYLNEVSKTEHAVCIDIGTCIKFDLISLEEGYLGGSISPGINLRYQSLNDYTGKLPLLSNKSNSDLVGSDTNTSIHSGVINGITGEIQHFIQTYRERFEGLTFFMTGGDARHFDFASKNDIFADENLTLKGLHEIYRYNA